MPANQLWVLPDDEVLPYDLCAPAPELTAKRISVLSQLPTIKNGLVLVSQRCLFERFAPKTALVRDHDYWAVGQTLSHQHIINQLIAQGYKRVATVEHPGDFAVRGSIIDCYLTGSNYPVRIDHFDDSIDSLRLFDVESQRTVEQIEKIDCLPADPIALDESMIDRFRANWRDVFGVSNDCPMYDAISNGEKLAGSEQYLPLFFDKTDSFFDYLPTHSIFIFDLTLKQTIFDIEQTIEKRYEQYRYDRNRPLLAPGDLFIGAQTICGLLKDYNEITLRSDHIKEQTGHWNLGYAPLGFEPSAVDAKEPFKDFITWQNAFSGKKILIAESEGRATILYEQLKKHELDIAMCDDWQSAQTHSNQTCLVIGPCEDGFSLEHLAVITENDLFSGHVTQTKRQQSITSDPTLRIRSLSELMEGDLVVHRQHGIAKYLGLGEYQNR